MGFPRGLTPWGKPAYNRATLQRRYVTADVFTEKVFGGNPLAVVLDAQGLTTAQMQSIATEFNYAETTFVLPARDSAHTAHVRIFTSRVEVPFAGHPNVGTAVVLARELEAAGAPPVDQFLFEEAAGLVPMALMRSAGLVVGAELTAPVPLTAGASVSVDDAAACLSLSPADICTATHPPLVLSVGLPFLVVEVSSRETLRRSRPILLAHERVLPPIGTDAVFAYAHGQTAGELHARVFAPLDASPEDPATGSATAAAISHLAALRPEADADQSWRIEQGVDMGRPSLLIGRTEKRGGRVTAVRIAGHAVPVMHGVLQID
jgi:trans-2,3-dihydro-3-hydroxyanthranilate isomerase